MYASAPLVKPHVEKATLYKDRFNTSDIITVVQLVEKTDRDDTVELAKQFSPTYSGLRKLFDFCDRNFKYREDPVGAQWIQTPSYLFHKTRVGDCKSFTVFISSVLHNMGLSRIIRYTHYSVPGTKVKHVYPIAILPSGRKVIMDLTYHKQENGGFDNEKSFNFKKDKLMNRGLYKLGNTAAQIDSKLRDIEASASDIPDSILNEGPGDITMMTSGQIDRLTTIESFEVSANQATDYKAESQYRDAAQAVKQGSIAGIGSLQNNPFGRRIEVMLTKTAMDTRPAFEAFKIPEEYITGIHGNLFKKIGAAIKKSWKKIVNWMWKGPIAMMSPYFIFRWIKKKRNKESSRRKNEQEKTFSWITKVSKFDAKKLNAKMFVGVVEKTGKAPQAIIDAAAGEKVSGIWGKIIQFAIKAIGWIFKIIGKLAKLFKKKKSDAGSIGEGNMSNPELLATGDGTPPFTQAQYKENVPGGSANVPLIRPGGGGGQPDPGGGGNMGLMLGGLALAALVALR